MRLFIVSYNKSGTHQIMPAFEAHASVVDCSHNPMAGLPDYVGIGKTLKPGGIKETCEALANFISPAHGHVAYLTEYAEAIQSQPTKVLFNVRDPRDIIIAEYHNMMKYEDKQSWLNFYLKDKDCYVAKDDPISHLINFAVRWEKWLGWLDHDFVKKVKYEDLRTNGYETCVEIAEWLKPYIIDPVYVSDNLKPRKRNPTFRKGAIGDWKEEFSSEHKKQAEKVLGHIIEKLGYEV